MTEQHDKQATPPERILIAVDGPAASGKGTIARALARHFGLPHMDTGMLYRAVALNLWRWGGDMASEFEALRACDVAAVDPDDPELRSEAVSSIASRISVVAVTKSLASALGATTVPISRPSSTAPPG